MKNLVDLHTHILPGLDDGAGDLEDSLRMARLAVVSGVRCVAATPHSCGYDGFDSALAKTVLRRTGLKVEELAMVGDRLYTDIETGLRSGMLSILVMSGETTEEILAASQTVPGVRQ